jgi:MFS family permease
MPVFVGKIFTATEAGQRLEGVTCEKCGTAFHYELTRVGVGKGSAPYLLGQASAAGRAGSAATRDLAKRLSEEAELVPCPKCHWVNQDLVDRYRRRQYRRAPLLIVIVVVAGFVAAPILGAGLTEAFGYSSRIPSTVSLGVMAVCLLSPAWVLLGRRQLRRSIDPNITYPRRPTVPPGTPPALIEERDPQTGDLRLVPVAASNDDRTIRSEWAMFRPGQVQLPPVCCMCLSPAATVYRSPLKVNENSEVEVPLCEPCRAQLRRRWWLVALAVAAASVVVSAACAALFPYGDAIGRWGLFGILGFFAALIGGVMIASRVCQPYRLKVVDTDRGIVKFAASNPAYTAMLVEQVRASDGLATR